MSSGNGLTFAWRHVAVVAVMTLCFGGLATRAIYLHVIDQEFLRGQGDARMLREETIAAHRGILKDRNGLPLAVSTPVVSIWVNPKEAIERKLDVRALASALDLEPASVQRRIKANERREFLYVKRHLSPEAAEAILANEMPGVYGMTEYRRFYPEGEVTSHLLGFHQSG
jgi:cell division protein FtsI (penicillin-binding protein 3)